MKRFACMPGATAPVPQPQPRLANVAIVQGWLKSAILGGGSSYKDLGLSLGGGSSYKEINPVPEAARNRI